MKAHLFTFTLFLLDLAINMMLHQMQLTHDSDRPTHVFI